MLLENKIVGIVGGGPSGLTLARLLQLRGATVRVFERDANREVRVQGATLDLHAESGLEALRHAGLLEEFYKRHRPDAGRLRLVDKFAQIKVDDHENEDYAEDRPEIDRGPLRELLLDSLLPETVVWDSQFVGMQKQGGGWLLHFGNGRSVYVDIVVAGDGANSKIRPYLTDIKPIYSGVTIVEGCIYDAENNAPRLWHLTKGGKVFAAADEKTVILSAKGDGSLSFYTGCKVDENWVAQSGIDFGDKAQVKNWFEDTFAWDAIWSEIFSPDAVWFVPRPQYHFPLDQKWESRPDLVLMGDAAHRMPPYAGEGVNMAMLDALELSKVLTNADFPDLESAIWAYDLKMLARAAEVTQDTLENTESMHSENALERLVAFFGSGKD